MTTKIDSLPDDLKEVAQRLIDKKEGRAPQPEVFDEMMRPMRYDPNQLRYTSKTVTIKFRYFARDHRPLVPNMASFYGRSGLQGRNALNQYVPNLSDTYVVNIPGDEHSYRRAMADAERKRVEMQEYYQAAIEMEYDIS